MKETQKESVTRWWNVTQSDQKQIDIKSKMGSCEAITEELMFVFSVSWKEKRKNRDEKGLECNGWKLPQFERRQKY